MYGLILEGIGDAMRRKFGDEAWTEVRKKAGIRHHTFNPHQTYSETVIPRLAKAGSDVTGRPIDELMELCGYTFIAYITPFGYDRVLRVLGRHLRDLLSGLDNLHEYLRFSYPKLKPPSFFVENESRHGLTLHYRSKRRGFVYYVMGQVTQLAKHFYNQPLEIELISEDETMDMTHVVMKLHFDNTGYHGDEDKKNVTRETDSLPVSADLFFDTFPFHIVFKSDMHIVSIGSGLAAVLPHLVGMSIDEMFTLTRPLVEFSIENVMSHLNNVFEVITVEAIRKTSRTGTGTATYDDDDYDPDDKQRCLKIKGQMMFMEEWDAALFLGTPVMENLDKMFDTGLYINDLSMHDSSRDLVLAGTQQQTELKMSIDMEKQKARKLEKVMKDMESMETKVTSLLTRMTPRVLMPAVTKGETLDGHCRMYENVTILSCDIQGFTTIIDRSSPAQAVATLNSMTRAFDALVIKSKCCKIESRGAEFMVCSGAPIETRYHAVHICDLALDLITAAQDLRDPASSSSLKVKIGLMSGPVTGAIVGYRVPVFDIMGVNVIAATQISQAGTGGMILSSAQTKNEVDGYSFEFAEGGTVDCKGVGAVTTFWLMQRAGGSQTHLVDQVDETADVEENITGFVPEAGKVPTFPNYRPLFDT